MTLNSPCEGIRVIDMTALISGPFCSQILSDLGAEVIRIENVGTDVMRYVQPSANDLPAYFEQVNRGKKSFQVDIKTDEGRAQVQALARTADIFLQNSRPGVMERLGFGYEELKKENPGLIYLSISGFGEDGPFANRAAYDPVVQGLIGFMPLQGTPEEPEAITSVVADKITAMWAANAAVSALLQRERSDGKGQKVTVTMAAAWSTFMLLDWMDNETFRDHEFPVKRRPKSSFNTLSTADGKVIGMVLQPKQCKSMCEALGCPDVANDERFSNPVGLSMNAEALYAEVQPIVAKLSTEEFLSRMSDASVPFGPVNTHTQFMASEEAKHSGAYSEIDDPEYGKIRHVNYPAKFEKASTIPTRRAPKLGEHNEELLAEIAAATGR